MKKAQLVKRLARESGISPAAAADQLDNILSGSFDESGADKVLRYPAWGVFLPGPKPGFHFEETLPSGARRVKAQAGRKAAL